MSDQPQPDHTARSPLTGAPRRFRKRPVVIEAEQFFSDRPLPWRDLGVVLYLPEIGFHVQTLEGPLRVSDGDWIIRGVKGEFYPCKPDIFEVLYEPAELKQHDHWFARMKRAENESDDLRAETKAVRVKAAEMVEAAERDLVEARAKLRTANQEIAALLRERTAAERQSCANFEATERDLAEASAEIARLRAQRGPSQSRNECRHGVALDWNCNACSDSGDSRRDVERQLAEARAEIARLREAADGGTKANA